MGRSWAWLLLLSLCGFFGCSASAAFYCQGLRALAAGDYPRANQALSLTLVEAPQHVGALTALGIAYYRQDAYDAAIEPLERAHALAPADPRIRLYLGLAWLKQGQLDQVREHLAAFLEGTRSRVLQEQAVRALGVLDEGHLSEAVRVYLADSLDAALQQEQQITALREEVRTLEAQRVYSPVRLYRIRKRR